MKRVGVSDHAVVRYMERVAKIDVQSFKDKLAAIVAEGAAAGAQYVKKDGLAYVLSHKEHGDVVLTTIFEDDGITPARTGGRPSQTTGPWKPSKREEGAKKARLSKKGRRT